MKLMFGKYVYSHTSLYDSIEEQLQVVLWQLIGEQELLCRKDVLS